MVALESRIEQALQRTVADGTLVGVAAAAWAQGRSVRAAFGDASEGLAMQPDTVVWIASMTKAITAAAVMQLVERGVVELDQPAGDLVPYLAGVQVLDGFGADGQPILRPPVRPVTLRHLLTHTSGFGYDFADASLARYRTTCSTAEPGSQASYEDPLVSDPGEQWSYGIGIDWAGRLVEAASGRRLDAYLDQELLEPLAMRDTTFERSAPQRARSASMHLRTDAALSPFPFELPAAPEMLMGGGGLYSTADDYLRFARMILDGGTLDGARVLSPATVATMTRNHLGDLSAPGWASQHPVLTNDVALFPGEQTGWGLSFLVNLHRTAEGRSPGSVAWAGLCNSYYWIDPTAEVAGVFVTQVLPFFDAGAIDAFAAFERAVYDSQA